MNQSIQEKLKKDSEFEKQWELEVETDVRSTEMTPYYDTLFGDSVLERKDSQANLTVVVLIDSSEGIEYFLSDPYELDIMSSSSAVSRPALSYW